MAEAEDKHTHLLLYRAERFVEDTRLLPLLQKTEGYLEEDENGLERWLLLFYSKVQFQKVVEKIQSARLLQYQAKYSIHIVPNTDGFILYFYDLIDYRTSNKFK